MMIAAISFKTQTLLVPNIHSAWVTRNLQSIMWIHIGKTRCLLGLAAKIWSIGSAIMVPILTAVINTVPKELDQHITAT